jgi:HlyD family secretion protein
MTANIDVLTDRKGDVIAVSSRAVIIKNGGKVVNILKNNGVEEVKVTTGLRGSDGNVEIVSGVDEGDKVIVNPVK